jgi:hypothetical protein
VEFPVGDGQAVVIDDAVAVDQDVEVYDAGTVLLLTYAAIEDSMLFRKSRRSRGVPCQSISTAQLI